MSATEASVEPHEFEKWTRLPSLSSIQRTADALRDKGVSVEVVANKQEALRILTDRIPMGSDVMTGASASLGEIGFLELLKSGTHHWRNLKGEIIGEKDPVRQRELRVRASQATYFVGSVHAVAETGEIVVASATGSQIPAYAYNSPNVIWVVGAQKIVAGLDEGVRRVREYCLPVESGNMKKLGYPGSTIGKLLIIERERAPTRRLSMILVNERIGV